MPWTNTHSLQNFRIQTYYREIITAQNITGLQRNEYSTKEKKRSNKMMPDTNQHKI